MIYVFICCFLIAIIGFALYLLERIQFKRKEPDTVIYVSNWPKAKKEENLDETIITNRKKK